MKHFVATVLAAAWLATNHLPTIAQDANGCQSRMSAYLAEFSGTTFEYRGLVHVTACGGLWLVYEDGSHLDIKNTFATEDGFDFFETHLTYVARMLQLYGPVPMEYLPEGPAIRMMPSLDTITPDRSDLALSTSGVADTIVFRFSDQHPLMLLKFFSAGRWWFGSR